MGISPQQIRYLGFSAGASLGVTVTTSADAADQPDFVGLVYGPMFKRDVPKAPPPLFTVRALDDPKYALLNSSL